MSSSRIIGLDYLRVLAAFSVVWIHACHTDPLLLSLSFLNSYAVPAFILISFYFFGKKYDGIDFNKKQVFFYLLKKIGIQYVFWTCIYLLLRFAKAIMINEQIEVGFSELFLGGSTVQLWFLPALVLWYLIMIYYWNWIQNIYVDIIVTLIIFVLGRYLMINEYLSAGFLNCFALYSGYLFLAKIIYKNITILKRYSIFLYLTLGFTAIGLTRFFDSYIFQVVYSSCIFLFFLFMKLPSLKWVNSLSYNSFGIYLAHFIFIQMFLVLKPYFAVNSFIFTILNILISFIFSYVLSIMFRKIPLLKNVI
jgi:surface polysaccharide O-acyltransferase-like enzyme